MAIGGRFKWKDQGETPNTMFAVAQYPNGQYVFFNVRNVNYSGYQKQVENEYYFEDGGKIVRGKYYPKGSSEGESYSVPEVEVTGLHELVANALILPGEKERETDLRGEPLPGMEE